MKEKPNQCSIAFKCISYRCLHYKKRDNCDSCRLAEICFSKARGSCLLRKDCFYNDEGNCTSSIAAVQQITKYLKSIGLNLRYDGRR